MPLAYIVGRNTKMKKWELMAWVGVLVFLLVVPVSVLVDQVAVLIVVTTLKKYATYLKNCS